MFGSVQFGGPRAGSRQQASTASQLDNKLVSILSPLKFLGRAVQGHSKLSASTIVIQR